MLNSIATMWQNKGISISLFSIHIVYKHFVYNTKNLCKSFINF